MQDDIRWGILGTGAIAGAFVDGLGFLPDARVSAVGSRTAKSARAFAERFGIPRHHESYEALVQDRDVDVVYIASPNHLHKEHCLLALRAGKAVLCEKPFALDAAEAREVAAVARERGLFCMEALWTRCVPAMREVRDRIRAGEIGELRMGSFHLGMPFVFDPSSRVFAKELGGGALLDLGVYPVSVAQFLFGNPVRTKSQAFIGQTGVDEQALALLEYEGGQNVTLTTSVRSLGPNDGFVMGTTGCIRIHAPLYCPERYSFTKTPQIHPGQGGGRGKLAKLRHHPWVRPVVEQLRERLPIGSGGRTRVVTKRFLGNGYSDEAAEVMRCLRASVTESPLVTLDDTVAVLETLDAIRAGFGEGKR